MARVLGAALWLTAGLMGAAAGQDGGDRKVGPGRDVDTGKQILIQPRIISIVRQDLTRLDIDWIALADGTTTRLAEASQGLHQDNQDRLDLSFIPLVGKALTPRYTADDVSPDSRVGSAWFTGQGIFVALDPARTMIGDGTQIVVLNDTWSFTLQVPARIVDVDKTPAFDSLRDLPVFHDFADGKTVLPEAQSLLIGGLDTREAQERASKVPVLSNIPLLGHMFAGSAHQKDPATLLVLVRPSIVAPDE